MKHSIPFHRAKNITTSEWFEILYTCTSTCCKNILKFQVPYPPGSQIMAFLSFPYFWSIRVSPIQRLSIKFEYFLRPFEFLIFFNFLVRFHTQDSESEVRIHFNDRFDCQFLHFTSLSDTFLVQLQMTNAKKLLLRIPLKFA